MSFVQQVNEVIDFAINEMRTLIEHKGEKSKHTSDKCLIIQEDEFMYNLEGGRYLTEVHENILVDNSGYHYNFSVLDTELLMQVFDHLYKHYEG